MPVTVNCVPDMKNPYLTVKDHLLFFVFTLLHYYILIGVLFFVSNNVSNGSTVSLMLFCEQEL